MNEKMKNVNAVKNRLRSLYHKLARKFAFSPTADIFFLPFCLVAILSEILLIVSRTPIYARIANIGLFISAPFVVIYLLLGIYKTIHSDERSQHAREKGWD